MTDGSPLDALAKALYIAWKDARVYYFKAPNFTYGLLMPVSLFLAFSLAGEMDVKLVVSGLPALAVLFGTTSIEAVAIVLEKQTGTFDRLLAAPVSFLTIMVGKALSGFFFGTALGVAVLVPVSLLAGVPVASPLLAVVAVGFSSLCFAALGVLVSAYANWVPEAQMVSNLIRFPMTFLAGAFIPFESMPPALLALARVMPLTYSVEALRIAISDPGNTATYLTDILALALFSAALLLVAAEVLRRRLA